MQKLQVFPNLLYPLIVSAYCKCLGVAVKSHSFQPQTNNSSPPLSLAAPVLPSSFPFSFLAAAPAAVTATVVAPSLPPDIFQHTAKITAARSPKLSRSVLFRLIRRLFFLRSPSPLHDRPALYLSLYLSTHSSIIPHTPSIPARITSPPPSFPSYSLRFRPVMRRFLSSFIA
jgi:hypothetical protein